MTSELNFEEFKKTLTEMTVEGTPSYKGSLFALLTINFSEKPFYGFISKNDFEVSKNSNINLVPYTISGSFKKNGDKTSVDYEINPIKFGYYWNKILPIFMILVGVIILAINFRNPNFDNTGLIVFLFVALFLMLFANANLYFQKKRFEKLFLKTLKIIED